MFRKLAGLAGMVAAMDLRPLVAVAAIGYGVSKLQQYTKQRQAYLAELNKHIEAAEARWNELSEAMAASAHLREPYPAPEDLNPLGVVELDLAATPA